MAVSKIDPIKTALTITVGFLIIFLLTEKEWAIYVATLIGLAALLSDYLSIKINWLWTKLTWVLSLIVPNILMSIVFYLVLFPIATLSRISKKNPLSLKNKSDSLFINTKKSFTKKSFENPW
ncbi:hypothetical protein [Roseivirga sp.]|uniref:hypothetical protein n=1 Tax=Roseivirga sp. TaxID=1964215 RepID=UPI003B8C0976